MPTILVFGNMNVMGVKIKNREKNEIMLINRRYRPERRSDLSCIQQEISEDILQMIYFNFEVPGFPDMWFSIKRKVTVCKSF